MLDLPQIRRIMHDTSRPFYRAMTLADAEKALSTNVVEAVDGQRMGGRNLMGLMIGRSQENGDVSLVFDQASLPNRVVALDWLGRQGEFVVESITPLKRSLLRVEFSPNAANQVRQNPSVYPCLSRFLPSI
jgi:hypothetical protein